MYNSSNPLPYLSISLYSSIGSPIFILQNFQHYSNALFDKFFNNFFFCFLNLFFFLLLSFQYSRYAFNSLSLTLNAQLLHYIGVYTLHFDTFECSFFKKKILLFFSVVVVVEIFDLQNHSETFS